MAKKKLSSSRSRSKIFRTFESNLYKLAYFLGATERWYAKEIRILGKKVREARTELPHVEIEIDKLLEKSKLSIMESKRFDELVERAYDLSDVNIFVPMDMKLFRQLSDLIRVLGLSYLVTIFKGYLVDIVREILLACPDALRSARIITAETVLSLGERKQIVSYLAEKEVEELKSFPDVVNYFDRKFNINLNASEVSAGDIIEIIETRNIHMHNRGVVNQRYLQRVKGSTLKVGTYKSIPREYLRDSISSIRDIVDFIDTEVQRKYFAD